MPASSDHPMRLSVHRAFVLQFDATTAVERGRWWAMPCTFSHWRRWWRALHRYCVRDLWPHAGMTGEGARRAFLRVPVAPQRAVSATW